MSGSHFLNDLWNYKYNSMCCSLCKQKLFLYQSHYQIGFPVLELGSFSSGRVLTIEEPLSRREDFITPRQRAECQEQIVCLSWIHFPLRKHGLSQRINSSELLQWGFQPWQKHPPAKSRRKRHLSDTFSIPFLPKSI